MKLKIEKNWTVLDPLSFDAATFVDLLPSYTYMAVANMVNNGCEMLSVDKSTMIVLFDELIYKHVTRRTHKVLHESGNSQLLGAIGKSDERIEVLSVQLGHDYYGIIAAPEAKEVIDEIISGSNK